MKSPLNLLPAAWAPGDRQLFYYSIPEQIGAPKIWMKDLTDASEPRQLFTGLRREQSGSRLRRQPGWQRFILLQPRQRPADVITAMIVVQNWTEELKRIAATLIPAIS